VIGERGSNMLKGEELFITAPGREEPHKLEEISEKGEKER